MEVAPGLYQLKVPMPGPLEYVLAYLFPSDGGYTLVDPGWPSDEAFDALESQLRDIGVAFADIRRLIITHVHHDHYGLAARVKEASGAEVLLHESDWEAVQPYLDDPVAAVREMQGFLATHGVPREEIANMPVAGQMVRDIIMRARPDRTLRGGEVIEGKAFRWEVIWTPGHSAGHVCLYERERQLLLSGDHVLPVITPHLSYTGRPGSDPLGDFLRSLEALKPLAVRAVFPAHEFAFDNLRERIEQIELHHLARMREMLDALVSGPLTAYEVAHHVTWVTGDFRDFDFAMQGAAVRETLAHLEHGVITGHIVRELSDGLYRYRLAQGAAEQIT
jgi:glyoxylase-like metal-dependent hydrolase (beta-lactamase superfamily II)